MFWPVKAVTALPSVKYNLEPSCKLLVEQESKSEQVKPDTETVIKSPCSFKNLFDSPVSEIPKHSFTSSQEKGVVWDDIIISSFV